MMKRALSVVLALVMLASLLVAPVSAVKAKPMERIREEEGSSARRNPSVPLRDVQTASGENLEIDIYFVDETDLGSAYVNIYPQDDPPDEVDTSEELDFQGIEKDGHNYYKITLNTELYDRIFFHDGQNGGYESGHQTEELQFIRDAWDDPLDDNGNRYVVYYVYREDGKLNVNEQIKDVWPQEKRYTTPPTCTEPGAKAYVGLRTGVPLEEEPVPALDHLPGEPVKENVTAPTETSEGGYDMVVYCQRCGIELSRVHTVLPALDPVDLYFVDQDDNAEGWVYGFGDGNENAVFPGEQMTPMGVDENGDNWYKVTVDRNVYTNVIFSGGDASTQTANLDLGSGKYVVYYVSGHTGYVGADVWPAPAVVVAPSCTEAGTTTYTGLLTGELHVTETPALGHNFGEWAVTTPATCTEAGVETRSCSRCDAVETRSVDALGHDFSEWAVSTEPTCTEAGVETRSCSRCDAVETRPVDALGHDFGEWAVSTEPTCTEAGVETRSCSRCDATETRPVDALGHKSAAAVKENEVPATCTAAGSYDMVVYCERCGAELSREHFATEQLPHTPGETVIENETAATCTAEGGYDEVMYCTVCGTEISRTHKTTEALGHNFGEWAVTTPATCTEAGVETRSCSRCDVVETRPVDALGHLPAEAVEENRVEPTYTAPGSYDSVVYCQRCGVELSRETVEIPMLVAVLENGYYLIGPDGWTVNDIDENNVFTVNPDNQNEYLLTTALAVGDEIKVVQVENGQITGWWPGGSAPNYTVDEAHAGSEKTIYFKTSYDNAWADFGGYFYIEANPVGPEPVLDENLTFYMSLNTKIELYAKFTVRMSTVQDYESWYLEVSKLDGDGNVIETKLIGEGQEGEVTPVNNIAYLAEYRDVTAKELGVDVSVVLHAIDANGVEHYGPAVVFNYRDYIVGELLKEDNEDAVRKLCADILNYGAAAQVYFEYDVEHPVNENLSTEAQAAMDQFASTGEAPADLVNGSNGPNVYGSVSVKNRIVLSMTVRGMGSYETMKVRIKNHEDGSVKDTIDAKKRGSVWVADYDGFEAEDMRTLYDFVPVADGEETGTPLTWSVEGYAREARLNPDATSAELNLFNALLHYVDAVKAAFPS